MTLRGRLTRALARIEGALDRMTRGLRRRGDAVPVVEPYLGYADRGEVVLRGRVLTALRRAAPRPDQGRFTNFRQMVRLFLTDEVADVTLAANGRQAKSDEEGYFTLPVPANGETGWIEVEVTQSAVAEAAADAEPVARHRLPAFVPPSEARRGVISDIDDTLMATGAWSRARMLWTSFTGNILTRTIFPDAVTLMTRLARDGADPVYYVSSSPWNLHDYLERIFARNGLPRGPLFLRDLGIGESQLIGADHTDHKGAAIDRILAANPALRFVLVGDTGQLDAAIYDAAARRHPDRIERVILRISRNGADAADSVHVRSIRSRGIPVHVGDDFSEALEVLGKPA